MLSCGILPILRALRLCGVRRALPAALLLAGTATPSLAQVGVRGDRDLLFGTVTRGIPSSVAPADPVRSGQWTVTGNTGSRVQIRLTVPPTLTGPAGATLPVTFTRNDAFILPAGGNPRYFNPGGVVIFVFPAGTGSAMVRLGGRVAPAAGQAGGAYSNTVLLTMTVLN